MKTSRPVDARLLADGEDSGLQSELGGEHTRLYGGCHEHAARFDPVYWIGEGPGLNLVTLRLTVFAFGTQITLIKSQRIHITHNIQNGTHGRLFDLEFARDPTVAQPNLRPASCVTVVGRLAWARLGQQTLRAPSGAASRCNARLVTATPLSGTSQRYLPMATWGSTVRLTMAILASGAPRSPAM
eukprot:scaffold73853_cov50-Phaeocystis_antarctica.AAC.8